MLHLTWFYVKEMQMWLLHTDRGPGKKKNRDNDEIRMIKISEKCRNLNYDISDMALLLSVQYKCTVSYIFQFPIYFQNNSWISFYDDDVGNMKYLWSCTCHISAIFALIYFRYSYMYTNYRSRWCKKKSTILEFIVLLRLSKKRKKKPALLIKAWSVRLREEQPCEPVTVLSVCDSPSQLLCYTLSQGHTCCCLLSPGDMSAYKPGQNWAAAFDDCGTADNSTPLLSKKKNEVSGGRTSSLYAAAHGWRARSDTLTTRRRRWRRLFANTQVDRETWTAQ